MRARQALFILCSVILLFLAGCTQAQCKKAADCISPPTGIKSAFTTTCVQEKCVYAKISGKCGNGECEVASNENSCTCEKDCKPCKGAADITLDGRQVKSQYLEQHCNADKECVADLDAKKIRPLTIDDTITSAGNTFKISSAFNQPFNLKRDTFGITIGLERQGKDVSGITITKIALTGITSDKRSITLAEQKVDKLLEAEAKAKQDIRLMFFTGDVEGALTDLKLKATYTYRQKSGTQLLDKTAEIVYSYKSIKFSFVKPEIEYTTCPKCDDNDPATDDVCGSQTQYFCEHRTVEGVCGNYQCDGAETKCTCPGDCGACTGAAGKFLAYQCAGAACSAILRPDVTIEPKTIFEEKKQGDFDSEVRITYSNPFAVKDTFTVELKVTRLSPDVQAVSFLQAQVLSGQQELGLVKIGKTLSATGRSLQIAIPVGLKPATEQELSPELKISYQVLKGAKTVPGSFSKTLEKITFIDVI